MQGGVPNRGRNRAALVLALAGPLPWLVSHSLGGLGLGHEWVALLAGVSILAAAFLLSWSTELAERDIPQALAILVLALVAVLPEYAVDLHFAWAAGKDPAYAHYAVANMTGANRLLIGFGWAAVVLVACARTRTSGLSVHPRQRLEMRYLIWATLYSFLIPLSGTISLFDGAVLLVLFGMYVREAMRGDAEEVELAGPALLIDRSFHDRGRRIVAIALFVFAAWAIFSAAEPFAEALVAMGHDYAIDEFLLVQWVAPLASESPEFVVAVIFAYKLRGSVGIGTLISSKVNQWTLLVGAIPVTYALSLGAPRGLPLDGRQTEELVLTSAQSLLAALLIADLRFGRFEAVALALLFAAQLFFPSTEVRWGFIGLYMALVAGLLVLGPAEQRRAFVALVLARPLPASGEAAPGSVERPG